MDSFFLCLQFPRSSVKSHSQTHIESHLNLALRGLEATQHQVHELVTVVKDQSKYIERQSGQIERQSQQIDRQSEQIERLMSKDQEQLEKVERLIERLTSRVEDQSQQIKRLMSKDKEQSEKMERSISTVQDQPPQREQRVPIDQIFPTPFEWEIKIPNITSRGLVSKPFFLFERGYKYLLQVKIHLKRLHIELGVYIKVVPGEFDELLSWPCREKVRVTYNFQDCLPVGKTRSHVIDFKKDREPCSRPLNDNHHAYRLVLCFAVAMKNTILIRVNRE